MSPWFQSQRSKKNLNVVKIYLRSYKKEDDWTNGHCSRFKMLILQMKCFGIKQD